MGIPRSAVTWTAQPRTDGRGRFRIAFVMTASFRTV
jgi:hypothetical protein